MSYVPNNQAVFTTAFTASLAAMNVSSRPFNPSANTAYYTHLAAVAGAFAQQFDTLFGKQGLTELQFQLMNSGIASIWEDVPPPTEDSSSLNPVTYNGVCSAVIAMMTAASTYYGTQSIVPFPGSPIPITGNLKACTNTVPIDILEVDISLVPDNSWGAFLQYSAECSDGTDNQTSAGYTNLGLAYKPSTLTMVDGAIVLVETQAVTDAAGSITTAFAWSIVGTVATLQATVTSTLGAPTLLNLKYALTFVDHPVAVYL